jgi:hypothetical protein
MGRIFRPPRPANPKSYLLMLATFDCCAAFALWSALYFCTLSAARKSFSLQISYRRNIAVVTCPDIFIATDCATPDLMRFLTPLRRRPWQIGPCHLPLSSQSPTTLDFHLFSENTFHTGAQCFRSIQHHQMPPLQIQSAVHQIFQRFGTT